MKITIRNTDGNVIIEGEYSSIQNAVEKNRADLSGANLNRADLSGANLKRADLSGANLKRANLSYADLSYADLSGANLSYADLRGADLSGANLSYADLSGADLNYADLGGADLSGVDLSGANLYRADLRGAIGYNPRQICQLLFLYDQPDRIRLYKLVDVYGNSPISSPIKINYLETDTFAVNNADIDPIELCGAGINVATLDWCVANWKAGWRILVMEFEAKDIACIPYTTDGKIRLHRCKRVGEVDLVECGLTKKPEEI